MPMAKDTSASGADTVRPALTIGQKASITSVARVPFINGSEVRNSCTIVISR